jgi:hypothetical protein
MVVVGGACLATAVIHPRLARSADHLDAPAVSAEAAADINDLYSFTDGNNAVFAMTVFPVAAAGSKFSNTVQYAFHTASGAAYGAVTSEYNIICQFTDATPQVASCWGGTNEYATGDASSATGITSADGKFKVFAGVRADPFFFNLAGFRATVDAVKGAVDAGIAFNGKGCPAVDMTTSDALLTALKTNPDGGGAPEDFFAALNTLAIVVSIDKTLVTTGGAIVSSWASTNRKP